LHEVLGIVPNPNKRDFTPHYAAWLQQFENDDVAVELPDPAGMTSVLTGTVSERLVEVVQRVNTPKPVQVLDKLCDVRIGYQDMATLFKEEPLLAAKYDSWETARAAFEGDKARVREELEKILARVAPSEEQVRASERKSRDKAAKLSRIAADRAAPVISSAIILEWIDARCLQLHWTARQMMNPTELPQLKLNTSFLIRVLALVCYVQGKWIAGDESSVGTSHHRKT
jgi:hypothetical protein